MENAIQPPYNFEFIFRSTSKLIRILHSLLQEFAARSRRFIFSTPFNTQPKYDQVVTSGVNYVVLHFINSIVNNVVEPYSTMLLQLVDMIVYKLRQ